MILIGLSGKLGCGKDTVGEYLRDRYGFRVFSFSDALYREVTEAFGLDDDTMLRDRSTKDSPQEALSLQFCADSAFAEVARHQMVLGDHADTFDNLHERSLSPREVLQWWGTEYRRAQDPNYWVNAAEKWIADTWRLCAYPEHRPQLFVNVSVRFENERKWIHSFDGSGNVWHIRREHYDGPTSNHVSETPLPVLWDHELKTGEVSRSMVYERELFNNDTVERLHGGIDLMFRTNAKFVRVDPMLPDVPPPESQENHDANEAAIDADGTYFDRVTAV